MVKKTHISFIPVSVGLGLVFGVGLLFAFLELGKCDNTCDIHTTIIRQVENTGLHRDIHSLVEIITSHPALSEECRIVLVETLPSGIYVNPDQLADFRRLGKLQACPTERVDVELPQRNASPSTIHVYSTLNRTENLLSAKVVLPVHLRYHNPTEHGGYAPVTLRTPSLLLKCDVDVPCVGPSILAPCGPCSQDLCEWLNVTYKTNSPKFLLLVPVGNIGHHPLEELRGQHAAFQCYDQRRWTGSMQVDHTLSSAKSVVDPYQLLQDDLEGLFDDIRNELRANTKQPTLQSVATYYFDGQGKAVRPMVAILMARAINSHLSGQDSSLLTSQRQVAMISEMIHSASLIHDDVIDQSNYRRGKPSVNVLWNPQQVAMAGDFILGVASMMIARLGDDDVTIVLSQVVSDLVRGEFMQLGSKLTINDRFAHYLSKSYRKTASLIANTAKATALLAGASQEIADIAFQYGRNIGIAFQLVDDMLDFVSSSDAMGKPTAVDLKLGLATAPVLFACEKYPQLNLMILRRFEGAGDVENAFELVHKSQGLEETQILAQKYCLEAVRYAKMLEDSPYQQGLQVVSDLVLHRLK